MADYILKYTGANIEALLEKAENAITTEPQELDLEQQQVARDNINAINRDNPTGTGSLSLNRKEESIIGDNSIAIGLDNVASGAASFAEGDHTTAIGVAQHVGGRYNIPDDEALRITGNGSDAQLSNAEKLMPNGDLRLGGDIYINCEEDSTNGEKLQNYTLPVATSSTLGGVKIGSNLSIDKGEVSVRNFEIQDGNLKFTSDRDIELTAQLGEVKLVTPTLKLSNTSIEEVKDPVKDTDAATKKYVDNQLPIIDSSLSLPDAAAEAKSVGTALSNKINTSNPVGTGSLSMNREADTVVGNHSTTLGTRGTASGKYSVAEGYRTTSQGECSHAEGQTTIASGNSAHAEGRDTDASGVYSHAEGRLTEASNACAHAEGQGSQTKKTVASGQASHAEGYQTTASGTASHAEGQDTVSLGSYSHAEGYGTTSEGSKSHAEGNGTLALGINSHAEGLGSSANRDQAHAEGNSTLASGFNSHAEGNQTIAIGNNSHAEGLYTIAAGTNQHVAGKYNISDAFSLRITGNGTSGIARKNVEQLTADGDLCLAGHVFVGCNDDSSGGAKLVSETDLSDYHDSAKMNVTNPTGTGYLSLNKKDTGTIGTNSATVGENCVASAGRSFAEGLLTVASGNTSHSAGRYTRAKRASQFVFGASNVEDPEGNSGEVVGKFIEIVGNGPTESEPTTSQRSNARALDWDGNQYLKGDIYVGCDANSNDGIKIPRKAAISVPKNVLNLTGPTGLGLYPRMITWPGEGLRYVFLNDRYKIVKPDGSFVTVSNSDIRYFAKRASETDASQGINITEIANAFPCMINSHLVVFFRARGKKTTDGVESDYYSIRAKSSFTGTDGYQQFDSDQRSTIIWSSDELDTVSVWEPWIVGNPLAGNMTGHLIFSLIRPDQSQDIVHMPFSVANDGIITRSSAEVDVLIDGSEQLNMDGVVNHKARLGMASFAQFSDGNFIGIIESSVNNNASNSRPLCVQYFYSNDDFSSTSENLTLFLPAAGGSYGAPSVAKLPDNRIIIMFMSSEGYGGIQNSSTTFNRIERVFISKIPITPFMPLTEDLFTELYFFDFAKSQYGRWGSVYSDGTKLYALFTYGYNTSTSTSTRYGNLMLEIM